MRIRDAARRVLGFEHFDAPRSPPDPAPRLELQVLRPPPRPARPRLWSNGSHARGGSFAAGSSSELLCNTNQSVSSFEVQYDLSDLKDVDFVIRTYYAGVDVLVGRLVPTSIGRPNVVRKKTVKQTLAEEDKATEREPKEKAMLEIEKDNGLAVGGAERVLMCKKNDDRGWFCKRTVSEPNSLCSHHAVQKREAAPPAPPVVFRPSVSSKPACKRNAVDADEPYLYYDGFGPSRSKRYFSSNSSILQEIPSVVEQQESTITELQQEKPALPKSMMN